MRKLAVVLLMIFCAGCVTVKVPKYLQSEFPYKKQVFHNFEDTLAATTQALKDLGWYVSETSHPSVFEQGSSEVQQAKQVLIFTGVRQTPLILFSRYMSLNVYVKEADGNNTDVEIRYMAVTPILFKNFQSYKNDAVVNKVFDRLEELLGK